MNGHCYVGQTTKLIQQRFNEHRLVAKNGGSNALSYAIRKYGEENFIIELIERCDSQVLNERETHWIAELNTAFGVGYNMTSGGGQCLVTDEVKQKISRANRGRLAGEKNPFYGKTHTPEAIEKIRAANIGRTPSPESIEKQKKSMIDSGALAKRSVPVSQFTFKGELVKEYPSIHEASRQVRGDSSIVSMIHNCCNGKQKQTVGFVFRYKGDAFDKFDVSRLKRNTTAVIQYDKQMNEIARFDTINKACDATGAAYSNIIACCKGRIKTSMGFVWRYEND